MWGDGSRDSASRPGRLLTVAAVTGPEFDTAVVGEVAGQPMLQALDGFDEAVGSRLAASLVRQRQRGILREVGDQAVQPDAVSPRVGDTAEQRGAQADAVGGTPVAPPGQTPAIPLASASADPEIVDDARRCRLITLVGQPDVDACLHEAERTIAAGYPVAGGGWVQLVEAYIRLGRLDELATLSAEMQEIGDRTGDRLRRGLAWGANTSEALLRGRSEDARIATDRILAASPDVPIFQLNWPS